MSDVRENWTARKNLRFDVFKINDDSWITCLTTVEQLGTPGLEGDVWRVDLDSSPVGVSEVAMKVFRSDFDMEHLLDLMDGNAEMDDIYLQIEHSARTFYAEASFDYEHENILRPHAFGKVANRNVIFMPVVEGDNLTDYITKNPDLSFEYRAKLCRELCLAVADLHEFGNYLHNDIKPDNIMVSVDSSGEPSLTIIDMGFACPRPFVDLVYGDTTKSVGTPGFIAPEVRRGSARWVSPASDVWSVGCTIFYILTSLELVAGVLDHKSDESQNSLYERLLENKIEPLIDSERMMRAGIENIVIAEGLEKLITPAMDTRKLENVHPLRKMAEIFSREGSSTAPIIVSDAPPSPPSTAVPAKSVARKVSTDSPKSKASTTAMPRPTSDPEMRKVILRPEGGMKQIVVLNKSVERYIRHQHVPNVETSHSKLVRLIFDGENVYGFPRSGLNCRLNGETWTEQQIISDGSTLVIEGESIRIEIR